MKSRLKNIKGNIILFILLLSLITCQNQDFKNNSVAFIYKTNESQGGAEIGMLNDSIKNGLWIEYYPNKVIKSIEFYIDGELQGPFLLFYENGNLKFESQIMNNEFEGERIVYFDNGKVQNKGYFLNGKQDSIWEFYLYCGGLDKMLRFEKGEVIDTLIDNILIPSPPPFSSDLN